MYHPGVQITSLAPKPPQEPLNGPQRSCRVGKGAVRAPNQPYLLEEPLPGRRQPVKAASREAGARSASLDGLASVRPAWLQADEA